MTLREVAPAAAVAWMGASLGLPPTVPEMLRAFDPESLPREPTIMR